MRFSLAVLAALAPVALASQQSPTVRYDVAFPNAAHHEAAITAEFRGVAAGTLVVRMSRSSPGRYALHEFAKNIYGVQATDGTGKVLRMTHPSPHQWNVATGGGTVRVSYILFGDHADGTYTGISEGHAHLNMPATFLWARGFERTPITVTFRPLAGWRIATQLAPTADSLTFTAPHLPYFMDSPTMLGPLTFRTWSVTSAGRTAQFRFALDHQGASTRADSLSAGSQRIVREAEGVWGELPSFDFGQYTFLAAYLPWVFDDGMEHRNSTSLTARTTSRVPLTELLSTVSHEFFHAWNVERLRPKSLEPFDLTDANPSQELWLAEGFTSYYGELVLTRAGLTSTRDLARTLGRTADVVLTAPGRRWYSAVEMSEQAPFVDAATSVDEQNKANTFISYYTWGAAIALGLDLALRQRSDTLSLDTFMRALWAEYGRAQSEFASAKPYRVDDARRMLGRVAGDSGWATDFFSRYITGHDVPDYASLLAGAGLIVRPIAPGKAWLGGLRLVSRERRLIVDGPVLQQTPAYAAGIEAGDQLAQLDGVPLTTREQVDSIIGAHTPGDRVPMVFIGRTGSRQVVVTLAANPHVECVLAEDAGQTPSPQQLAFRQRWLSAKRAD